MNKLNTFFHTKYNEKPITCKNETRIFPYYTYIIEINETVKQKEEIYSVFNNYSGCCINMYSKLNNNKKSTVFFEIYVYKGEHVLIETLLQHLVSINNICVLQKIKFVLMFHTHTHNNKLSKRIHNIYNDYYPFFQFKYV